jgi:tetratricopeptide (TPR) repeat protein
MAEDRGTIDELTFRRAQKLLAQGLEAVALGHFSVARERFQRSAETFATADAFTYWGWMEFKLGDTDSALELCHKAIELDPEFGNPYNDIGSYLFTQGKLDDAIPWLEQAVKAKRYEPRQFPHINLGRIYQQKGMPLRAIEEFRKALSFAPGDEGIQALIQSVVLTLN